MVDSWFTRSRSERQAAEIAVGCMEIGTHMARV